jgi:hypothetical protein
MPSCNHRNCEVRICDICGCCESHCDCMYCEGCSEMKDNDTAFCSVCECCSDCCDYHHCAECENAFTNDSDEWCNEHEMCNECCPCNKEEEKEETVEVVDNPNQAVLPGTEIVWVTCYGCGQLVKPRSNCQCCGAYRSRA